MTVKVHPWLTALALLALTGCTPAPPGTAQLPGRIYFQSEQAITVLEGGRQARFPLPAGITVDAIAPDGRHFTGSDGKRPLLFRMTGGQIEQIAAPAVEGPLAWAPDGSKLAAMTTDAKIRIIDPTGRLLQEFAVPPGAHRTLAWSPDGQSLAAVSGGMAAGESEISLIRLADGTVTPLGKGTDEPAWSPSGQQLAYTAHTGGAGSVMVRDTGGHHALVTEAMLQAAHPDVFEGHRFQPGALIWPSGGKRLLTIFKAAGGEHPVFGLAVAPLDSGPPHALILPRHPEHAENAKHHPPRPCHGDAQWAAKGELIVVKLSGIGCEGQLFTADDALKQLSEAQVDPQAVRVAGR